MDETTPDDVEAVPEVEEPEKAPKKAKKPVPPVNSKREAARAQARLLMDRRANERG